MKRYELRKEHLLEVIQNWCKNLIIIKILKFTFILKVKSKKIIYKQLCIYTTDFMFRTHNHFTHVFSDSNH